LPSSQLSLQHCFSFFILLVWEAPAKVLMFRLIHLTDPHIGPLKRPKLRLLLSKRLTGYANWRRGRSRAHDMELLEALIADIKAQHPDHIACTGDIANIGLPEEWITAKGFLEGLGAPDQVSFVPGNHDAYIKGALEGMLDQCGPWARGDGQESYSFPYIRRRGPVALIGLSSAIPTAPFIASGKIGTHQAQKMKEILQQLKKEGLFRVIMIHHPPHIGGAAAGRNLKDASRFEAVIREVGAELVLHGHNHMSSLARISGPDGLVPVIGASSASSRGGAIVHRAAYHMFTITKTLSGFELTAEARGLRRDDSIGEIGIIPIDKRKPSFHAGLHPHPVLP
jgi:3',5'-cyclic AMP phosphodiesterase CpdA